MKKRLTILAVILSLFLVAGCASHNNSQNKNQTKPSVALAKRSHQRRDQARQTRIKIKIGRKTLRAHLNHSSAAVAFTRELPMTMRFRTFMSGYPEKIADLPHALPTNGMPRGHAGTKGSIGYWSPQPRIVFYYGTESYYPGIHIIGKLDSHNYVKVIKKLHKTKVQISLSK